MSELLFELLGEVLAVSIMAIASVGFTVLGILGEQAAFTNLLAGQSTLGIWELFIGSWALFVGVYLIGVKQVLPRLSALIGEQTTH